MVTGADGFIGSHLVDVLMECGAHVEAFLRGSARTGCGRWDFRCLRHDPSRFRSLIAGDIGSPETIDAVAASQSTILFHLAAIAYVNYSFDHPAEVFRANATGTLNVLEGVRRRGGFDRVVIQSSSEVYGTRQSGLIGEDHSLEPTSPYAASKLAADRLAMSYRLTYGAPVVVSRPFNTYGPRHRYDVIPKFIALALAGSPITINGDGLQERDFSHVEDTVRGLLLLGSAPGIDGEVFNLGTGNPTTILALAQTIKRLTGSNSAIAHGPARAAEVRSHRADIAKAARILGFAPEIDLETGLADNIRWETANGPGTV